MVVEVPVTAGCLKKRGGGVSPSPKGNASYKVCTQSWAMHGIASTLHLLIRFE
jgi:hypothetical protein